MEINKCHVEGGRGTEKYHKMTHGRGGLKSAKIVSRIEVPHNKYFSNAITVTWFLIKGWFWANGFVKFPSSRIVFEAQDSTAARSGNDVATSWTGSTVGSGDQERAGGIRARCRSQRNFNTRAGNHSLRPVFYGAVTWRTYYWDCFWNLKFTILALNTILFIQYFDPEIIFYTSFKLNVLTLVLRAHLLRSTHCNVSALT